MTKSMRETSRRLHLRGIAARAERTRGLPVPDRRSLRRLWRTLLSQALAVGMFGTSVLLSWWPPGSLFAYRSDWHERSLWLSGVIMYGCFVVASGRMLIDARAVVARIEAGKSGPVRAVVGEGKRLEPVLEPLDGTGRQFTLQIDLAKWRRYTWGQEIAVYGQLRRGGVVALCTTGGVHWSRVKRLDLVRSRRPV